MFAAAARLALVPSVVFAATVQAQSKTDAEPTIRFRNARDRIAGMFGPGSGVQIVTGADGSDASPDSAHSIVGYARDIFASEPNAPAGMPGRLALDLALLSARCYGEPTFASAVSASRPLHFAWRRIDPIADSSADAAPTGEPLALIAAAEIDGRVHVAIAFRGTHTPSDMFENLSLGAERHQRLKGLIDAVRRQAAEAAQPVERIWLVGHSLGGMVAQQAARDRRPGVRESVVTFGSPAVPAPAPSPVRATPIATR